MNIANRMNELLEVSKDKPTPFGRGDPFPEISPTSKRALVKLSSKFHKMAGDLGKSISVVNKIMKQEKESMDLVHLKSLYSALEKVQHGVRQVDYEASQIVDPFK